MKIDNTKFKAPKAKPTSKNWSSSSTPGAERKRAPFQDQVGMSPPKTKTSSKNSDSRIDPDELEAALAEARKLTSMENGAKPTSKIFYSGSGEQEFRAPAARPDLATISREGIEAKVPDQKPSFIQLFEEQNKF